jgi:spore coat polysaccharide biosynthesis protein SpsF (cytidylyltransferase family)
MKEEIKISYIKKQGKTTEGWYIFREPNTWELLAYMRKGKNAKKEEYDVLVNHLCELMDHLTNKQ